MRHVTFLMLILFFVEAVFAGLTPYELDTFLDVPSCASVDVSPDGTKIYASTTHTPVVDEGYDIYKTGTYDYVKYCHVPSSATFRGLVSSDNSYLYTTTYYGGCVQKIDVSDCSIVNTIDVGSWTFGSAFDSQRRYLYVGENHPGTGTTGSIKVIDTDTDTVVGGVTLNGEPGKVIAVDPYDNYVYVLTDNSGTERLYKINTSDYSFNSIPMTGLGRSGISVSSDGTKLYVPNTDLNIVYVIDTATLTIVDSFSIDSPFGFFASPDGTHALVTGVDSPDIRVFDLMVEGIVQTIDVGDLGFFYDVLADTPYWDEMTNKVYLNIAGTSGGIVVLKPVPVPGAFILGGIGLCFAGWRLKRKTI